MKKAIELIKKHEGLRLKAYRCPAGEWTIGYGSTRYPDGSRVRPGDTLESEEEAEELLLHALGGFDAAIDKYVQVPLNDNQRAALLSWVYNLGPGNLAHSTLLKKLNAGQYQAAAHEFEKWVYASQGGVKRKLPGLEIRRKQERLLFQS